MWALRTCQGFCPKRKLVGIPKWDMIYRDEGGQKWLVSCILKLSLFPLRQLSLCGALLLGSSYYCIHRKITGYSVPVTWRSLTAGLEWTRTSFTVILLLLKYFLISFATFATLDMLVSFSSSSSWNSIQSMGILFLKLKLNRVFIIYSFVPIFAHRHCSLFFFFFLALCFSHYCNVFSFVYTTFSTSTIIKNR